MHAIGAYEDLVTLLFLLPVTFLLARTLRSCCSYIYYSYSLAILSIFLHIPHVIIVIIAHPAHVIQLASYSMEIGKICEYIANCNLTSIFLLHATLS